MSKWNDGWKAHALFLLILFGVAVLLIGLTALMIQAALWGFALHFFVGVAVLAFGLITTAFLLALLDGLFYELWRL